MLACILSCVDVEIPPLSVVLVIGSSELVCGGGRFSFLIAGLQWLETPNRNQNQMWTTTTLLLLLLLTMWTCDHRQ